MTVAPNGLSKSDSENTDPIVNAAAKPRAQRTVKEQKTIETEIDKADTTDEKAKVTTEADPNEVLPKAEPKATSDPAAPDVADSTNTLVPVAAPDTSSAAGQPVSEGQVQVTRKAQEGELSDPGGNVSEVRKQGKARAPKKDALTEYIEPTKLPLAATVGQIVAVVEIYAGRAVLSLSLKGWVGDAPLKILASDVGEIEQALAELRKELS